MPWIIGGIALVAAAAIAVVLVLVLGGSKSSNGPKDVADKFFKADVAKDIKTMKNLACGDVLSKLNADASSLGDKSYKLGQANENGDNAQVGINLTDPDGKADDFTVVLQKQSGKWKVCQLVSGSPTNLPSGGGGGGGGGGGDATAAQQTVQRLLQAGKDRDLPTAQALTCDPLHSRVDSFPEISDFQVGTGQASGTSAEVPFSVTSDGDTSNEVAELQQQGGTWKVCDFHDASDSSGGGDTGGSTDFPSGDSSDSTDFPSADSSDFPSDSDIPSSGGSKFCITPNGSTPICLP